MLWEFLLFHGLGSNCMPWDAVDLRGHGVSSKPVDGYSCSEVAADVATLLTAMQLPAPVFCGRSWGGNVALCLEAERPDTGLRGGALLDASLCYMDLGRFSSLPVSGSLSLGRGCAILRRNSRERVIEPGSSAALSELGDWRQPEPEEGVDEGRYRACVEERTAL